MLLTALYVPGDRPDRFDKAAAAADAVVLDLEDAVAPGAKARARQAVVEWLDRPSDAVVLVRVNAGSSAHQREDLVALAAAPALRHVRVAKVESASELDVVAEALPGVHVHAVVESASGLEALRDIARHPAVRSVGLGEADLGSELGLRGDEAFDAVRSALVVTCAAAGLEPPMLSVYADVADLAGLTASCRRGRDRGFLGRSLVHPRQVAAAVEGFRPDADEVAGAQSVLDALREAADAGRGVSVVRGAMVDAAMAGAAHRTLELAAACARHDTRIAAGHDATVTLEN